MFLITVRNASWFVFTLLMGPCFSLMGNEICLVAGFYTAVCAALATSLGLTASSQLFDAVKVHLTVSYVIVCLSAILCLFLTPPLGPAASVAVSMNIFGGILLYFGIYVCLVHDVGVAAKFHDVDPLQTSAAVFMCTVNLYLRLALMQVVENARMLHVTATLQCA